MKLVEQGEIKEVIITELSRWGRSLIETLKTIQILEKHNVNLIVLKEQINLKTSSGRLFMNILLALGEYERTLIGSRVRDVLQNKKENNKVYGTICYGYDNNNGTLVENPKEKRMLKKVKKMKNQGATYSEIIQFLNRNNYTKKNGKIWNKDCLKKLVKNHQLNPNLSSING